MTLLSPCLLASAMKYPAIYLGREIFVIVVSKVCENPLHSVTFYEYLQDQSVHLMHKVTFNHVSFQSNSNVIMIEVGCK